MEQKKLEIECNCSLPAFKVLNLAGIAENLGGNNERLRTELRRSLRTADYKIPYLILM